MARYVFLLLLVNVYYCGFGVSLPTDNLISTLLMKLELECPFKLISQMITKRISECRVLAPPYGAQQLQCLMLYDISSQLCSVNQSDVSKLTVPADIETQISSPQSVEQLCNNTKDWQYTKIQLYDLYVPSAMATLGNPQSCKTLCYQKTGGANDICKYFKILTELLKTTSDSPSLIPLKHESSSRAQPAPTKTNASDAKIVSEKSELEDQLSSSSDKNEKLEKPVSSVNTMPLENTEKLPGNDNDIQAKPAINDKPDENQPPETEIKQEPNGKIDLLNHENPNKNDELLSNNNEKLDKVDGKEPNSIQSELQKPPLKSKQDKDGFEYNDQEDGKDGLADSQGDDDLEDPDMENEGKLKFKPNNVNKNVAALLPVDTEVTQMKEPTYQDGFTEEDDHFFSFFLTAVILVVLLYVLYHNKNKVSKLILGLIFEGRQNGRRRNSRGHAYRRLDTLEQAMSSNTTTPPSKIIY